MENYQAQTPQNLALTIVLQKNQENKSTPGMSGYFVSNASVLCSGEFQQTDINNYLMIPNKIKTQMSLPKFCCNMTSLT